MNSELKILVLYYSVKGATESLARAIGRGIEMTPGCEAVLRAAPRLQRNPEKECRPSRKAAHLTSPATI